MKTLYLIRHAKSEANAGGISKPERNIALSPWGQKQAQALVARLPSSRHVYVSELRRTQQTAAPWCSAHGITPQVLPLLNEFSCLAFEWIRGMDGAARRPLADAYWQRADPQECTGAGADSFVAFNRRISAFLAHYPQLEDGSLLFGHGIWIGLLAWRLLGFAAETSADMTAFRRFQSGLPLANTSVWMLQGDTADDLRLRFQSS